MTHKIPLPDPQSESIALDHIALDWVGIQGITLPVTVDSRPLHGKVDIGVKLKKLGTSGDWTKVKFQGKTGYIKSNLLKKVK